MRAFDGGSSKDRTIVLVGMMGSGKTSVGRLLASRRGWPLVDSDQQVLVITGRSVSDVWLTEGGETLNEIECDALASVLDGPPAVVAASGGVVLVERCFDLLALHKPVIWLRAEPSTLLSRVRRDGRRPRLDQDLLETLTALDGARRLLYQRVADVVIDVDGLEPVEVVDRIADALKWSRYHGAPETP